MSTPGSDTATAIAAAVSSGARTARSVVDEHLARVEAREADIHAFNLVLADDARRLVAEAERDGVRKGP